MTKPDEFDWTDRKSLVVKRVDPIAVYKNDEGDIVIRQQHLTHGDAVVTIPGIMDTLCWKPLPAR